MKKKMSLILITLLALTQTSSASKISGVNVKSVSDLTTDGGTAADLTGTDKIYDVSHSQTLKTSIDNNVFAGGSSVRAINTVNASTYTLAATDGSGNGNNPIILSGSSLATTVTIPLNASTAIPIGSQVDLIQGSLGLVTISPQAGVTLGSPQSARTVANQYSMVSMLKVGTNLWDLFGGLGAGFLAGTCSGCNITTDGNFKVFTFLSSGTFSFTSGPATGTFDSLIVGGGGAGGGSGNDNGGGGAGGYISSTALTAAIQTYTVTVGAGGASSAASGSDSTITGAGFTTLTAYGGGGGGINGQVGSNGNGSGTGGSSGGGASNSGTSRNGGVGQGTNGHDGGSNGGVGGPGFPAGGGGGCGTVGANATSAPAGGAGGAGCSNSISGTPTFYAGGGGGYSQTGTSGAGGSGGGGAANTAGGGGSGTNGTANTGGGGGGRSDSGGTAGFGGSGIGIIRFQFQ